MPVNEILAPYYLKMRYNTGIARHDLRCYFETGAIVNPGPILNPSDWTVQGSQSPIVTSVSEIVEQIFTRAASGLKSGTTVENIEVWQSGPGSNTFLHSNVLPSNNVFGSAGGIAAAHFIFVFRSAQRQKFRMSFFDTSSAAPQRFSSAAPPLVDTGFLEWYMVKGAVPFATQDGLRLVAPLSLSTGYNRKLARAYGLSVAP